MATVKTYKGKKYRRYSKFQEDQRGQQAIRKCLRCGVDFPSEHRGHRICQGCKDTVNRMGDRNCMDSVAHVCHSHSARRLVR